ncbi:hypothetical protein [Streptomyces lavendofoliae]|uniref:hypothetical protein n=1 Tax=Streptomyces lavendofoliae TaxID=67314 RepID=UPI003D8E100C
MTLAVRDPGRDIALREARARATNYPAAPFWPVRLAQELRELNADWRESAEVCADVAWAARAAGRSALGLLSPDKITAADLDPVTARTYRHLYLSALRYDLRCATLQAFVEQLPPGAISGLDCYSRALYAFALLGQSRPEGLALMDEVLAEAGDHVKTLHVLLHGLWLGHDLDQGRSGSSPSARGLPLESARIRSCCSGWPAHCADSAATTMGSRPSTGPWIFCRRATSRCTPIWCASVP